VRTFSYIFLLLLPCLVLANNPIYQKYDVDDGLPSSQVYEVIQDDAGVIWIATDKGLSKFDGNKFENYTVKDGLPHNDIFGFAKDNDGRIWLNTLDKIGYLEDGKLRTIKNNFDLGVHVHYFGMHGKHFIQSKNKRINYLFDDNEELIHLGKDGHLFSKYIDKDNYCLVRKNRSKNQSENGYLLVVEDTIQKKIPLGNLNTPYKYFDVQKMGNKLICTYPTGLQILENQKVENFDLSFLGFSKPIERSFFISEGVFLKNKNRFVFFDIEKKTVEVFTLFRDLNIQRIFKDNEGNYWLSSDEGLYFISSLSINSESYVLGPQPELKNELQLIVETGLEGLKDMVQDGYGQLWLADDIEGCFRLRNLNLVNDDRFAYSLDKKIGATRSLNAVFKGSVKSIKMGPDNRLYIASAEGVNQVEFKEDHFVVTKLDPTRSYSVVQDLFGYIWIGRSSGISRFKDGKLIDFGPNHIMSNLSITDLDIDDENGLWIGSDGYGLFHDQGSIFCTIKELDGYIIKSLMIDGNQVWAGTNRGVVGVKYNSKDGTTCDYTIRNYSQAHGLASDEVNDVFVSDGYIYAATKNGVSKFPVKLPSENSNSSQLQSYKAPLIIQGVEVNGVQQFIQPSYELNHKQNNLKIDFAALSYRSIGANSQFLKFKINKPWYNRWWFILLNILFLTLLVYLFTQQRISRAKAQAQKETEVNKRFAELEMQAIRSQMNPHFLFNALHSIQDFIFNNNSREANRYISSFASLMRKILDASKKKYIYIYEELEMLYLYLGLEKLRFNDKFDYKINVDPEIDINTEEIPTRNEYDQKSIGANE